jgi:hypothetical protein
MTMHLQTGIFLIEIAPRLKCSIPHARCVVRNAMHVGYLEVLRVRRESPAANADDCGNLGKLAANAEAALNVYLNRLEPSSRKSACNFLLGLCEVSFQGSTLPKCISGQDAMR